MIPSTLGRFGLTGKTFPVKPTERILCRTCQPRVSLRVEAPMMATLFGRKMASSERSNAAGPAVYDIVLFSATGCPPRR